MQSLPQEVKSSELGRRRKPCISKRERKWEGNISAPFPLCFLCCMGELSRVWQASGVRSRIAGEDVPWKDYFSLHLSCDSLATNQHFLAGVPEGCCSCIIQELWVMPVHSWDCSDSVNSHYSSLVWKEALPRECGV